MASEFDPYKVLGIDRDATPAQVKSAFRRRAMQTHPDTGGSAKEFDRVNRSNIVLSDPKRREKFDRTGKMDEDSAENSLSAPLSILIGFMQAAIIQEIEGQGGDPLTCDLMKAAREQFHRVIGDLKGQKKKSERMVAKFRKIATKLKKKKGEDFLTRAIQMHANALEKNAMQADMQIKAHQDAITLTEEYEFDADSDGGFATVYRSQNLPPWMR